MRSIAGTRYGDFDKVEHMNVHTAFREIAAGMKEAAEMEPHSKQQDHDHVGGLDRVGDLGHLQASAFGLGPGGSALAQTHRHLDTRFVQVLCVGMALRAIADDGDVLALDEGEVGVLVVVDLHGISL